MSMYLCALRAVNPSASLSLRSGSGTAPLGAASSGATAAIEHTARFVPLQEGLWEATLSSGECFVLERTSADAFGVPEHSLWSLRVRRDTLSAATPWPFLELKVAELPLHPRTEAAVAGGWQCWSESPLLGPSDTLRNETFPEREVFGDSHLFRSRERPGEVHAWSFSTTQVAGGTRNGLFAAVDEDLFFARFEFDLKLGRWSVALDTAGAALENIRTPQDRGSADVSLAAWLAPQETNAHFAPLHTLTAAWMRLVREKSRTPRSLPESAQALRRVPLRGYTSWYMHYNSITESILKQNVEAFAHTVRSCDAHAKVFQVDDGYQAHIGDWLTPSAGFPGGVAQVASWAREKGLEAGIWCAPFIATEHSTLFKEHPEWLLRDTQGELVLCGNHPLWGGRFFALDTENPEFLAHLEKVLATFFQEWDFRFLKADFLYATARIPAGGLTRAQRSARAHEFLYATCVKLGAKLLSCGAPLASAYLRCDYSRIGADVGETWENTEFGSAPSREKVSTRGTLVNTLTRAALSGVAFGNDPDVCILREESQHLTQAERALLAEINFTLGDLVFTSDNTANWDPWARERFASLAHRADKAKSQGCKVAAVRLTESGLLEVEFTTPPQNPLPSHTLVVNLTDAPCDDVAPHSFRWQ